VEWLDCRNVSNKMWGTAFESTVLIHWSVNLEIPATTEEDYLCQSGHGIANYIENCMVTDSVKLASQRPEAA
jgi:hypothetical protein